MRSRFTFAPLAMSLLSFLGCARTATELPSKLADVRIDISVEHAIERDEDRRSFSRKSIHVELRDARGRQLERPDVGVEVNGIALPFRVSTGNYYDRHPYYQLSDDRRLPLTAATDYRFALVLPDGTRHDIGTIRMPAELDSAQFDFPTRRDGTADVKIGWRDLTEPAVLTVFRSNIVRESDGTEVHESGSSSDPAALRREIGPGWFRRRSAAWTLPSALLAPQESRIASALSAEVRIVHTGHATNTFAKGSTLTAERRLTLRMDCGLSQ